MNISNLLHLSNLCSLYDTFRKLKLTVFSHDNQYHMHIYSIGPLFCYLSIHYNVYHLSRSMFYMKDDMFHIMVQHLQRIHPYKHMFLFPLQLLLDYSSTNHTYHFLMINRLNNFNSIFHMYPNYLHKNYSSIYTFDLDRHFC
jgi:hypothetical protein